MTCFHEAFNIVAAVGELAINPHMDGFLSPPKKPFTQDFLRCSAATTAITQMQKQIPQRNKTALPESSH